MNQKAMFDNSVAVLVKAFLDGELECTACAACACGNLVAAANGYKIIRNHPLAGSYDWAPGLSGEDNPRMEWQEITWNLDRPSNFTEEGLRQVASTGYTPEQFERIEDAFMTCQLHDSGATHEEKNFVRLMNVVDVLAEIHGIDLTTVTAAKALFIKA